MFTWLDHSQCRLMSSSSSVSCQCALSAGKGLSLDVSQQRKTGAQLFSFALEQIKKVDSALNYMKRRRRDDILALFLGSWICLLGIDFLFLLLISLLVAFATLLARRDFISTFSSARDAKLLASHQKISSPGSSSSPLLNFLLKRVAALQSALLCF